MQQLGQPNTFLSTIGQRILEFSRWAQRFEGSSSSAEPSTPLLSTLQQDLAALQRTLERIEAVLYDAEEREISDVSVRLWLRELRAVAYDAEDVLDEHEYELLRSKTQAGIPDQEYFPNPPGGRPGAAGQQHLQVGGSNNMITHTHPLASRIGEIRKRFDEISRDRDALHLKEADGRRLRRNFGERQPSSSIIDVTEVHIQGRDEDLDKLINGVLLSRQCGENNLTVMPVVGMAGVGKTTLVQHVYNDPNICERFKLRGWVCVSDDDSDACQLTKRILESFTGTASDLIGLDPLQRRLMESLKDKRFLLVLDDVWSENRALWERLQTPLRHGAKGSAIVTTTRSEKIARILQTVPFHNLECLSNAHCWEIFQRFAFRGVDPGRDHKELVEIGEKIAQKCRGLPLAAKALGSMLCYEAEVESWEEVLESEIWELGERDGEILPALMLSYAHLPPHLKRCFVYCSLFPKDFRFQKHELVLLWMAQGFIQGNRKGRRRVEEDMGAAYVDELMQRSFFQYYDSKNASIFVMHDLIHDLAQYNSNGEYCRVDREMPSSDDSTSRARHLSIASVNHDIPTVLGSLPYQAAGSLRTLHLFAVRHRSRSNLPSELITSSLKGLRTLILTDQQEVREVPDSIGELKHLRYLDLSGTDVAKLPETVSNLYYLQTLLLRRCKYLESLPEVILKLSNLRCLEFSRYL